MGLRSGKLVNLRSIITGTTAQDINSSSLPLLSFNPLPSIHPSISNASSLSYASATTHNNNNNNNNNESSIFSGAFACVTLINHPSLDPNHFYPTRLEIVLDRPIVSREKQIEFGWNHEDRSMNIFVKHNDPCTFHRHVSVLESAMSLVKTVLFISSPLHKVPMLYVRKKASQVAFMSGKSNGEAERRTSLIDR
jgi:hypothetical protein